MQILTSSRLDQRTLAPAVEALLTSASNKFDQASPEQALQLLVAANRRNLLTRQMAVAGMKQLLRHSEEAGPKEFSLALYVCSCVDLGDPRLLNILAGRMLELGEEGLARDWSSALHACVKMGM